METPSGRRELAPPATSLDKSYTSARQRSRRCYQRVISGLQKDGKVRFVTLTTSKEGLNGAFQKHFRQLRMRLLRRGLLVDYIRCPEFTHSGLRHEHLLFRGSYIDQRYLSFLWAKIHNSPVVDIRAVGSRTRVAGYMAGYMAKAPAGRYAYSWGWVWKGFATSWKKLKRFGLESGETFEEVLTFWKMCCRLGLKPEEVLPI